MIEIILILAIAVYCIFNYPVIGWTIFAVLTLGVVLGVCRYLLDRLGTRKKR